MRSGPPFGSGLLSAIVGDSITRPEAAARHPSSVGRRMEHGESSIRPAGSGSEDPHPAAGYAATRGAGALFCFTGPFWGFPGSSLGFTGSFWGFTPSVLTSAGFSLGAAGSSSVFLARKAASRSVHVASGANPSTTATSRTPSLDDVKLVAVVAPDGVGHALGRPAQVPDLGRSDRPHSCAGTRGRRPRCPRSRARPGRACSWVPRRRRIGRRPSRPRPPCRRAS